MDPTGLNDTALVERYAALRADLDRTREVDKRLELSGTSEPRRRTPTSASLGDGPAPFLTSGADQSKVAEVIGLYRDDWTT